MLTVLKIRNLALVEDLVWELGPGLVGVTGETGAGKSVIVGALKLVLGERADKGMIRTGEDLCSIEAVFEPTNLPVINRVLADAGLDPCEEGALLVRRDISRTGTSKQFVNCSPATQTVLRSLGEVLVDLHGPHAHQSLLSNERQLSMLDAFGGHEKEVDAYRAAYRSWREAADLLEELTGSERATEQELDLLRHQVQEIDLAALQPEEEDTLEDQYRLATGGKKLLQIVSDALHRLDGGGDGDGVLEGLENSERLLRDLSQADPGSGEILETFASAHIDLREAVDSLRSYQDKVDVNPEELAALEDRVNVVEALRRKYGSTIPEIIAFGESAALRLEAIEGRGDRITGLQAEADAAEAKMRKVGAALGKKRAQSAPKLSKAIVAHLGDLGFKQCHFGLELAEREVPAAAGLELVEFMFSPNPGEPQKPLKLVASSGEMSRVMLAVKSALAKEDSIPLLVFDEIDANVGGEIAIAVGNKMASLGETHQVIAITHLPQVAALAASHHVVEKEVAGGRTRSTLRTVDPEQRRHELARMLGGESDSALAHADTLLGGK